MYGVELLAKVKGLRIAALELRLTHFPVCGRIEKNIHFSPYLNKSCVIPLGERRMGTHYYNCISTTIRCFSLLYVNFLRRSREIHVEHDLLHDQKIKGNRPVI